MLQPDVVTADTDCAGSDTRNVTAAVFFIIAVVTAATAAVSACMLCTVLPAEGLYRAMLLIGRPADHTHQNVKLLVKPQNVVPVKGHPRNPAHVQKQGPIGVISRVSEQT